jgi:hypothetical protein
MVYGAAQERRSRVAFLQRYAMSVARAGINTVCAADGVT